MSKNKLRKIWTILLLGLLSLTCEEQVFDNPYDPAYKIDSVKTFAGEQVGEHIKLTWQKNEDVKTGYMIERKAPGDSDFSVLIDSLSPNTTTYVDSFIITDKTYFYKILGHSGENISPFSETTQVETGFPKPTNLQATPITDTQIRLTWEDNSTFELGFMIDRKSEGEDFDTVGGVSANNTTYIDTELSYAVEYSYRVRSYTSLNVSGYSNMASVNTTIPAPSYLTVEFNQSDDRMEIQWVDNSYYETGYVIERKTNEGDFGPIDTLSADLTTFVDNHIEYGHYYTYRVYAITVNNRSQSSNEQTKRFFYTWVYDMGYHTGRSVVEVDDGFLIVDTDETIKLSIKGSLMWTQSYGGLHIQTTSDVNLVVSGDRVLHKIDPEGNLIWSITNSSSGFWVEECQDGGFIIAGGNLVRTNTDGITIWEREVDDGWSASSYNAVTQIADGSFIATGVGSEYKIKVWNIDDNGILLWTASRDGDYSSAYSILVNSEGDYVVSGHGDQFSSNPWYLVKFGADGSMIWSQNLGWGPDSRNGTSIVQDSNGSYIISGEVYKGGSIDRRFTLVKTDSEGNRSWIKEYGDELAWDVMIANDGGLVSVGEIVVKTDEEGNIFGE